MNDYDYSIKVTYEHGAVRTMQGTVSTTSFADAVRMVEDDEGMGWPEKRAKRETLYIIKVPS